MIGLINHTYSNRQFLQTINAVQSPFDGLPAAAIDDLLAPKSNSVATKKRCLTFEERLAKNAAKSALEDAAVIKTAS